MDFKLKRSQPRTNATRQLWLNATTAGSKTVVCHKKKEKRMQKIGKYHERETYYLELEEGYENHLPNGNWICFAIANEKPKSDELEKFIRNSIKNDLLEFKGQGKFGGYLHLSFDEEMVSMEVIENHPEIETMTTGNNEDDLANSFWECYGATCLPEKANYDKLKVICVSFDQNNYSMKLRNILKKFNRKWLPIDEERTSRKGEFVNLKLTKNESLVLFEFLARLNDENRKEIFADQAEERVLWDIECLLEKELVEPFSKDYIKLIKKARDEVRDEIE